jgi:hypothetical protein
MTHIKLKVIFIVTDIVEAPAPRGTPECKVQEQQHGAREEGNVPVIDKARRHEGVWTSGGHRSTHAWPRHYVEVTEEGIHLLVGHVVGWAAVPVRTVERRYSVAVETWTPVKLPATVTRLTEQSRSPVTAAGSHYKFCALLLVESLPLLFKKLKIWVGRFQLISS